MHDLLEEFLADGAERIGWAEQTVMAYRSGNRGFLAWFEGRNGRVADQFDFSAPNLQTYDTSRKRAGRKQNSRAAALSAWQSFARWLAHHGHIPQAQSDAVQMLHVRVTEKPRQKWATAQQVQDLFRACTLVADVHGEDLSYRAYLCPAILAVLAYCGLRRGELCKLTVSDVDLFAEVPTLTVRHGKGDKTRTVWLNPNAARYIKAWLDFRTWQHGNLFAVPIYGARYYPGTTERPTRKRPVVEPMREGRLIGILREMCRLAEINDRVPLAPHAFRRFAGTSLLKMPGCTLRHVMEFLGHSALLTTVRYLGLEMQELQALVIGMNVEAPPATEPPALRIVETPKKPPTESRRHAIYRRA